MLLIISIRYENTTIEEGRAILEFLKEHAEPYPGMEIHGRIIQNEPPHVVPEQESP